MKNERLNGIYTYNGFNPPELLAENIDELISNVTITDNYIGDQTELFAEDIKESAELAGVTLSANTTDITLDQADEITEQISVYSVYVNPTYEQLSDYNKSVGLDPDAYITEVFK